MLKGLRTARIIGSGLVKQKSSISRLDYRVGLMDCDFNRHLTNSKYPAYMDLGRWDIIVRTGALALCLKKRIAPVVVEMNLTFRRELTFGTPFTVDTRIIATNHRIITFEQYFLVDGQVHFNAEVKSIPLHRGKVIEAGDFRAFVTERYQNG